MVCNSVATTDEVLVFTINDSIKLTVLTVLGTTETLVTLNRYLTFATAIMDTIKLTGNNLLIPFGYFNMTTTPGMKLRDIKKCHSPV